MGLNCGHIWDRWTSADSLHPLSCHAEDHQHWRKTGVCGGDIELYIYYSVPVLKADNILRRGLVQPFIWDQPRYISASSFSVTSPSLCPGGSSRDHRGESHSLKSARASSRPGNNGEAYPLFYGSYSILDLGMIRTVLIVIRRPFWIILRAVNWL